jgi:hypothetical protein
MFYHPRISCLLEYLWVQLFSHLWINILESIFSHHLLFGGYYVASEQEQCVVACMREFFLNSWLHKLNRILTSNVGFFSFLFFSFFAGGSQCDWEFCTRWANVNEYTILPNCSIWFKCLCIPIQQWYHTHQSTQSWGLANAFSQQWWKHMIQLFKFLAEVFGPLPHWATKFYSSWVCNWKWDSKAHNIWGEIISSHDCKIKAGKIIFTVCF